MLGVCLQVLVRYIVRLLLVLSTFVLGGGGQCSNRAVYTIIMGHSSGNVYVLLMVHGR